MSLHAYPAIPIPTAASAANASTFGVWTDASAIQPPASTAAVAISRLWARTRRSRSITQHVLVQPLVPRHEAVHLLLGGIAVRTVADQHQRGRDLASHAREDPHHVGHPLDRPEVRHVYQHLVAGRGERPAARVVAGRMILRGRDEVGDHDHVAVAAAEGAIGFVPQ